MRILYVSHLYDPEPGAQPVRVRELTRRWARAGHEVTVLAGFPNHPHGRIYPGYRARYWRFADSEDDAGVRVVRTWLLPRPNRGALNRALVFSSYTVSAALTSLALRPVDVVIGTVPQPLAPLAAWFRTSIGGARFVLEVRDLWPEGLVATGHASAESLPVRALDRVARFLYGRADHVVAVTDAIRDNLIQNRGVKSGNVDVIRAGVDAGAFAMNLSSDEAKTRLGVEGRFVVSYVGTVGDAHGLDVLLDAAALLKSRNDDRVLFLVAGTGAQEAVLRSRARDLSLDNVRFLGQIQRAEIPHVYGASDVCVAILRDDPLFRTVVPTKLYEYMAAGRGILCNVPGEASELVEQAGAGLAIAPGDGAALADAVADLAAAPQRLVAFGEAGRRYAATEASWDRRAADYLDVLERVVDR